MAKRRKIHFAPGVKDSTPPARQAVWLVILSLLFFFGVCFSSTSNIKLTVMVLLCATLLGGILCFPTLRGRVHLPLILLLCVVLMGGLSTIWALSGKFALRELLKLVSALCMGLLLLMLTPGEGVGAGRRIATVLEGSVALMALLSVDLISTRWLSTPILSLLGEDYQGLTGVEVGVRMTSIFLNPNIFAGCVGIGVLLSLGLVLSSEGKKERRVHLCCLLVSSAAFILAFSMGATAAIAAAFLVYLLLEHKDRRGELFLLMVETLLLSAAAAAVSSAVAFDAWDGVQPIPLLSLVAGAALLCLADRFIGQKLAQKLRGHGKLLAVVIAVILVLAVVFALCAYYFTGPASLERGETLRRAAYPAAGCYTVSAVGGEGVQVTIETQNRYDAMMHTSTVLYKGSLSDAAFTVPEDSIVVYFNFRADASAVLEQVEFSGEAGSGGVPLGYRLLPDFIANRLQGLSANQNAIQRVVFFEDGIKLFQDSPVIGFGLGAFENAIHRVQSFFYETKYVHNHYIQTLLETGVVGLILFVGLLAVSVAAVLFARRKQDFHPLTPALGALLVFLGIHAATEVVFSSYPYLPLAFGVFLLIDLCCAPALPLPHPGKRLSAGILSAAAVLMVIFAVLLGNNISARRISDRHMTFDALERSMELDKFEWADYALSYVMSAQSQSLPEPYLQRADELAQQLSTVDSNTIPYYLADYYFSRGDQESGFAMAEKFGSYLCASSNAWNDLFSLLERWEQPEAEYRAGVLRVAAIMEQWDSTHIGSIELTDSANAFLERMSGTAAQAG